VKIEQTLLPIEGSSLACIEGKKVLHLLKSRDITILMNVIFLY